MEFLDQLKNKIMVLDGAMGTMIKSFNLDTEDFMGKDGCNEILNESRSDIIKKIHNLYIDAGADIIETNTFNCNSIALKGYGLENKSYDLNLLGTKIAVSVAKEKSKKIWVAGSVGPTSLSLFMEGANNLQKRKVLKEAYYDQIKGIVDGGADIILLETVYDFFNLEVALEVTLEIFKEKNVNLPIFISVTINESGRIFSGESIKEIIEKVDRKEISGYGFNCSFGAKKLIPFVEGIKKYTDKYIIFYPNAGLPDSEGKYADTPEIMANYLKLLIEDRKVDIIGGCCGTTPDHIKAIASIIKK